MGQEKILVWLPSPMGDAVLSTPALVALRDGFAGCQIVFGGSDTVRETLMPCRLNDGWIITGGKNFATLALELRRQRFTRAILFKNSFSCALVVFLAGIGERIGYGRDCRRVFLNKPIRAQKKPGGGFEALSMVEYYLRLVGELGCRTSEKLPRLEYERDALEGVRVQMPELFDGGGPIVILVPGGMFGPSKCWPAERFAQAADFLAAKYNARIFVSVAPNDAERAIARKIMQLAKCRLFCGAAGAGGLRRSAVVGEGVAEGARAAGTMSIARLKALFSQAGLVITNDTGPRHIAIALGRRVISMFGPNDPAWTQTGYEGERQLVGTAPCAPCRKPRCSDPEHTCMNSITVEQVCRAAAELLGK